MLRSLYLSPLGGLISAILNLLARFTRPFMVYGYRDGPSGTFRKHTRISSVATLMGRNQIQMSDHVWIGHYCVVDGSNGVVLGEGVQLAFWAGVFSHGSETAIRLHGKHYIQTDSAQRKGYKPLPVQIGAYTYIGSGACVLPGSKLGKGCLVAAGAVVRGTFPDHAILQGNPAKVIGSTLDLDRPYILDPQVQASYYDPELVPQLVEQALELAAQQQGESLQDQAQIDPQ